MPRDSWKESASWLGSWTIWWMTPVVLRGARHVILDTDIPEIFPNKKSAVLAANFEKAFEDERKINPSNPRMFLVTLKALGIEYTVFPWFPLLIAVGFYLFIPLFMVKSLITFVATPVANRNYTYGGLYIGGFLISILLQMTFRERTWFYTIGSGIRVRQMLISVIYNKALRLASVASSVGEIVAMQSNDANRIHELIRFGGFVVGFVLMFIGVVVILILEVGVYSMLTCLGVFLVFYAPLQFYMSKYLNRKRQEISKITDRRVRVMNEILGSMKLVKLYNWEQSFAEKIAVLRHEETKQYFRIALARTMGIIAATVTPTLASYFIFVVFVMQGFTLTPAIAFTVTTLIESIRFFLDLMPHYAKGITDSMVGYERLRRFLLQPEAEDQREHNDLLKLGTLQVKNASFSWPSANLLNRVNDTDHVNLNEAGETPSVQLRGGNALTDLSFKIKPGELVAVVGSVASGKTSLLASLAGQLKMSLGGSVEYRGSVAYATQQPWLTNDSVKDNILFYEDYDEERYAKAISSCQLLPDLEQFIAADLTEIGERGINLSGGQKQRVSLARAVYSNKDIYLLDDILSAVDQHVGKKIFRECIKGALSKKTRVVAMNQLHYLPECDRVIVLRKGRIDGSDNLYLHFDQLKPIGSLSSSLSLPSVSMIAIGTFAELVAKNVDFGVPLESKKEKRKKEKGPKKEKKKESHGSGKTDISEIPSLPTKVLRDTSSKLLDLRTAVSKSGKLIVVEDKEVGRVSGQVYVTYLRSAGPLIWFILLVVIYLLLQALRMLPDLWLSWWMRDYWGKKYP